MLALALLLIGTGISVHLEEQENVAPETVQSALEALARAIETRTGTQAVIQETPTNGEIVGVRAFAGAQGLHIVLEHRPSGRDARVTLPKAQEESWPALFRPSIEILFPAVAKQHAIETPVHPPPLPPSTIRPLPWVLIGSGIVALASGIAFGAASRHAQERIEEERHTQHEYEVLDGRQARFGITADVLFGASAAAIVAGVTVILIE